MKYSDKQFVSMHYSVWCVYCLNSNRLRNKWRSRIIT